MALSSGEETTFIYDHRFGEHLERKLDLMRSYGDREPRIDPNIMWRVAALPEEPGQPPSGTTSGT